MLFSRRVVILLFLGFSFILPRMEVSAIECVFNNPIIAQGQDPSVVYQDGYYYLVQSNGGQLTIAKSSTITGLGYATPVGVFSPPSGEPYSHDMWAPELVYIDGNWYIYVAATNSPGANATHRMYVLQADTDDPQGTWTVKGKVYDPAADKWAIDGTVFEYQDQLYMVWSGWPGDTGDFPQNLYIAEMSDPLTLSSGRYLISEPEEPWEMSVAALQEGPEAFIHEGQLSIVYSADASWTTAYKLGLLKLVGDDPLDAASWEKVGPIFSQYEGDGGAVYGPGHNSMPIPSPDGTESWNIYHAKTVATDGWADRAIFIQRFTWNEDGTPNLGEPIPSSVSQELPAGEFCGSVAAGADLLASPEAYPEDGVFDLEGDFVDTGVSWINTQASFSVAASVRLGQTGTRAAIISQEGGISSHFILGYTGEHFALTLFDGFSRELASAVSEVTPDADQWYHLVGVYDVAAHEIRLYIDGELAASTVATESWHAPGNTIIGAAKVSTQRVDPFTGAIQDIELFSGALDTDEIQALAEASS
ncbi:family 43 glycosylhydrolase [Phototrophicus methaneseepsis]|uniref:Family 43 glycosylhydrolase n=1 Tax=Phototrophicus methaneseepsis TaxID=2710758 RepID=A0A7S8IFW3_9CHLR|nr:family 43 glycosylhydrolase [Phototrophicus methaneseepsis]QPC83353.1 family 43 glycosylhydrolase [Phototrophicus methaneseepsis]